MVEVVGHSAVGDEFIDEEEVRGSGGGTAIESNEVGVAQAGEDFDFIHELFDTLVVGLV